MLIQHIVLNIVNYIIMMDSALLLRQRILCARPLDVRAKICLCLTKTVFVAHWP